MGINATRLFSVLYHRTLNVGRVQTPTLAILDDTGGKYINFKLEFPKRKDGGNGR